MKMSNKSAGTMFEREFAGKLAKNRFWVHRFQDNKNGQPCDVIAARNGKTYLFDCKDCTGAFQLSRVEENQYNAMYLFHLTGNSRGMFAVRYDPKVIFLVDYQVLKDLQDRGVRSIPRAAMTRYGRTLNDWLQELNDSETGDEEIDHTDWR